MVDLQPTNQKLRVRAVKIVREATGVTEEVATGALGQADGEVKTAIAGLLLGVSPDEARQRLAASDGRIRPALEGGAS